MTYSFDPYENREKKCVFVYLINKSLSSIYKVITVKTL